MRKKIIIEYLKENKKLFIALGIIIIIIISLNIYSSSKNKNKIYASDEYIYEKESHKHDNGLVSKLPFINIKGNKVSLINKELMERYYEAVILNKKVMFYDLYKNDNNISSIIIRTYDINEIGAYPEDLYVYNIDIKRGILLDNYSLYKTYNINGNYISEIITNKIKEYYDYELENKYIDNTTTFDEYLDMTDSNPIMGNCYLYVKNDKLMAYKVIKTGSEMYYDQNNGFDLFKFMIK